MNLKALSRYLGPRLSDRMRNRLRPIRDKYRDVLDPYPYRRYLAKNRCIFIHIPKTAGTSIITLLGGWAGDHCSYREYLRASPSRFNAYFKFCFVRNPYDRLISSFEYLVNGGNRASDLRIRDRLRATAPDFSTFVMNFIDADTIYRINVLRPQYWYIFDEQGELMVDKVGRFENIEEDLSAICHRLHLDVRFPLPSTNASPRSAFAEYYDDELLARVRELYRLDFELLGY